MTKRTVNNVIDLRTGKPIESPKQSKRDGASEAIKRVKTKDNQGKRTAAAAEKDDHKWEFKARFRKGAFGWKSEPAIKRIKEALSEIKQVAKKDLPLAGEGAVILIERLSPAIEHVDSSSGWIGSAVYKAIEELTPIIAKAKVSPEKRADWLERLYNAQNQDEIAYLESLGNHWGELCGEKETASYWADKLVGDVRTSWSDDSHFFSFKGTTNCLSALLKAERYDELLELLKLERHHMWHYQQFGTQALAKMGKVAEAIEFAFESTDLDIESYSRHLVCEQILLEAGQIENAYENFAINANRKNSNLATYRAIAKKYPTIKAERILGDLIKATPGEEGKWFATAKDLGLLDLAVELIRKSYCDPRTLTRAVRDFKESNPAFAAEVGLQAIYWLMAGYGYEITAGEVWQTLALTLEAARGISQEQQYRQAIEKMIAPALKQKQWTATMIAERLADK